MAESYNGYCVKCKDKRDFDGGHRGNQRAPDGKGNLPGLRHQDEPDPGQSLTSLPVRPVVAHHRDHRRASGG